ncbi:unnamed protein product [Cyprideis torosa]|uniref:Uncharacterized protein n=1 Tax=Cyprideis torosa TaxID=163714 RepID=A0A7R8ZSG1_9CRUS|nr:unnamed protein product [Cyprideis torosa]CAG0895966.1 unnamed protein product [Cyprideis torosa]
MRRVSSIDCRQSHGDAHSPFLSDSDLISAEPALGDASGSASAGEGGSKDEENAEEESGEAESPLEESSAPVPPAKPPTPPPPKIKPKVQDSPFGLAMYGGLAGLTELGLGSANFAVLQQRMTEKLLGDPDTLLKVLDNPLVQSLCNTPAYVKQALMANPQTRLVVESHPEVIGLLQNSRLIKSTMESLRQPFVVKVLGSRLPNVAAYIENSGKKDDKKPGSEEQDVNEQKQSEDSCAETSEDVEMKEATAGEATPDRNRGDPAFFMYKETESFLRQMKENMDGFHNMLNSPHFQGLLETLGNRPEMCKYLTMWQHPTLLERPGILELFRQQMPEYLSSAGLEKASEIVNNEPAVDALLKIQQGLATLEKCDGGKYLNGFIGESWNEKMASLIGRWDVTGQAIKTLKNFGFADEAAIAEAIRVSAGDVNDAAEKLFEAQVPEFEGWKMREMQRMEDATAAREERRRLIEQKEREEEERRKMKEEEEKRQLEEERQKQEEEYEKERLEIERMQQEKEDALAEQLAEEDFEARLAIRLELDAAREKELAEQERANIEAEEHDRRRKERQEKEELEKKAKEGQRKREEEEERKWKEEEERKERSEEGSGEKEGRGSETHKGGGLAEESPGGAADNEEGLGDQVEEVKDEEHDEPLDKDREDGDQQRAKSPEKSDEVEAGNAEEQGGAQQSDVPEAGGAPAVEDKGLPDQRTEESSTSQALHELAVKKGTGEDGRKRAMSPEEHMPGEPSPKAPRIEGDAEVAGDEPSVPAKEVNEG